MSPDSVVLEVALVDLPATDPAAAEDLWKGIDEQHIPPDLRRRLADHGLRCGVVGDQLPDWVASRLDERGKYLTLREEGGAASVSDVSVQRRIQCRPGGRRSIPVADPSQELVINPTGAATSARYFDAQCHLAVAAYPQGNGPVRVRLTPEIQHGPPRQRWVGQDGAFRIEGSRECVAFDQLAIEAALTPGQTLCFAATPEAKSLGKAFFDIDTSISIRRANGGAETAGEAGTTALRSPRRFVLVRLAQTQADDLFSPQQRLAPITTPPP
jgi:hypothetical protein